MIKNVLKRIIETAGIYYCKRRYLPLGIDWLWDIHRFIQRSGSTRDVHNILDVGANIGQTVVMLKAQYPDSVIHAFEPIASTYGDLLRNVGTMKLVTCHRLALTGNSGVASMITATNSVLSRLITDPEVLEQAGHNIEEVRTETVDMFCSVHRLDHIDLLKIDTQGSEISVLEGASGMLREGNITFAFVEVGFDAGNNTCTYFPDLMHFLTSRGMRLCALYDYSNLLPPHYADEGCVPVFGNALFISDKGIKRVRSL